MSEVNEAYENLLTRRSIRKYKKEIPGKEIIEKICTAGTYAPTGKNQQSPIILAVSNPEMRERLSKMNAAVMNSSSDPFYGAPVVLVVLAKKDNGNAIKDGSCVMMNLMNAANSLGLGSCWINRADAMFESEEGKQILADLGITDEYVGVGNCIIGYIDGEVPAAKERKENWVYYID